MKVWPEVNTEIAGMPLDEAHRLVVEKAEGILPFDPGVVS